MQKIRNTFRKKQNNFDKEALQATKSLPPSISKTDEDLSTDTEAAIGEKQIRSISCDEIMMKDTETSNLVEMAAKEANIDNSLDVPANKNFRSKSLDSPHTGRVGRHPSTFLEIPKWKMLIRKSSTASSSSSSTDLIYFKDCFHCLLIEHHWKTYNALPASVLSSISRELNTQMRLDEEEAEITSVAAGNESDKDESGNSQEDVCSRFERSVPTGDSVPTFTLSLPPDSAMTEDQYEDLGSGITVISLEVPVSAKQARSASVDSSFLQVPKGEELVGELPPSKSQRSRSVDIALPIGPDGPYLVVPAHDSIQMTTQ